MKTRRALLVLACSFGMFAYTSCQDNNRGENSEVNLEDFNEEESDQDLMIQGEDNASSSSSQGEDTNAITGTISRNKDLKTFSEGMTRAGIDDDFSRGEGPYTIFAPSNIAYDELSQDERNQFENASEIKKTGAGMHYLVVKGKLTAADLKQQMENTDGTLQLTSLQGETLRVSMRDGNLVVTDPSGKQAKILESDMNATNGIVHIIDRVLHPKDLTKNANPPRDWNTRNDQMDWEEGDENSNGNGNNNTGNRSGNNSTSSTSDQ
ncbi:fasciclin domain-containing protein [Salinimicrobium sp. GXAS 041]|uniref:fasciclin domain-containing protein n=1 Tax=Salinimicrobium sp. GXAS 041 TaxID=3400806 RepID=UPI003C742C63